jgi:membrane-associated protease RseP (regulator of RpoE activity)
MPQPTHNAPYLKPWLVSGAAAGDVTVTGIKVADRLAAVVALGPSSAASRNLPTSPANFEISTNFDIQNGDAFNMLVDGVPVTIATDQVFDTGTTVVTAADTWVAAILSIDADGTTHVDYGAVDLASEELAIASLDVVTPSGDVVLGYVTILTNSGNTWTAGTDALQGGTGGNASADTNYYNDSSVGAIAVAEAGAASGAELTSEFSITAADTINNTGGTSTAGQDVLVLAWVSDTRGLGFNRT